MADARERVHRAQQRDLRVERLTGPGGERGGDAEQRAVRVLEDERRAGGVPGRVAARLEGRAHAARGERRGVRLALDQLLARELGERGALTGGVEERVVLLGREAGERLEPVREVGGALLECPVLHRGRHRVRERGVDGLALLERALQALEDVLGEPLALDGQREDVGAERVVARLREIGDAEGGAVGAPLGGGDVLLTDGCHVARRASYGRAREHARSTGLIAGDSKASPAPGRRALSPCPRFRGRLSPSGRTSPDA